MSDAKSKSRNDESPSCANDWSFAERTPNVVLPPIIVGDDDFDENDVVFQSAPKNDVAPTPGRDARQGKTRKLFGIWPVPRRWRQWSTRRILWRFATSRRNLATTISVLLHLILAFILASIALTRVGILGNPLTVGFSPDASDLEFVEEVGDSLDEESTFEVVPDLREISEFDATETDKRLDETTNRAVAENLADVAGSETANLSDLGDAAPSEAGGGSPFFNQKGATSGRVAANRKRGLPGREGDVTDESEDAVERGLAWLARHQASDGGWSFDLAAEDSSGRSIACRCSNTTGTAGGTQYLKRLHPSRTAATAIALLPFLGAGYTHTEKNRYRETVEKALTFLKYNAADGEYGRDFRALGDASATAQGGAYIQALVVLALSEAFEMTNDASLKPHVAGGLRLVEESQLDDGGWRYASRGDVDFHSNVKDGGDASILGWQLMALKSGVSAGFELRPKTIYRASDFLDSVMESNGRYYRYLKGIERPVDENWATTAVGALSREYLGWAPGTAKLDVCVRQLGAWIDENDALWQKAKKGNDAKARAQFRGDLYTHNLYFSYYAALALHHYGGKLWKREFPKLRSFLVETQSRGGLLNNCEDGSWLFYDEYVNDGGRLLNTAFAILILETPYRYLPMYR